MLNGNANSGKPNHLFSLTTAIIGEKSTIPKIHASTYPDKIPQRKGIILIKPLPLVEKNAVAMNVNKATMIFLKSPPATSPAFDTALEARPRPITMIIGPITIGGNNLSIQALPINLTHKATRKYTTPTRIKPV